MRPRTPRAGRSSHRRRRRRLSARGSLFLAASERALRVEATRRGGTSSRAGGRLRLPSARRLRASPRPRYEPRSCCPRRTPGWPRCRVGGRRPRGRPWLVSPLLRAVQSRAPHGAAGGAAVALCSAVAQPFSRHAPRRAAVPSATSLQSARGQRQHARQHHCARLACRRCCCASVEQGAACVTPRLQEAVAAAGAVLFSPTDARTRRPSYTGWPARGLAERFEGPRIAG